MKQRILYVIIINIMFNYFVFAKEGLIIESVAEQAEINFEDQTFEAEGGLKTKYQDVQMVANKMKKVKDRDILIAYDKIVFKQGANTVEAETLELDLDNKNVRAKDGKSSTKVVGGKNPRHDELYYGGEMFEALFPNKAIVKNAFMTTCHGAVTGKENAHYYIQARKMVAYLGKRVVAYNAMLYIKGVPVMWFPMYITSLKTSVDSAPLFPKFGSDAKYGTHMIWGFDYGEQDSKWLNGSLALNLSENRGLSVDTWHNKYTIEKGKNYGDLRLKDTIFTDGDQSKKQHNFEHEHHYDNEKGKLNWAYKNKSLDAMNNWSKEEREKYKEEGGTRTNELYRYYKLKSDFKNLRKDGDLDISTNIEWTEDKDIVKEMSRLENEELAESEIDPQEKDIKLTKEVSLTKRDKGNRYLLNMSYKENEDLNPGNKEGDTYSHDNKEEYKLKLNKLGIDMKYSKTDKDLWRNLTTEELILISDSVDVKHGEIDSDSDVLIDGAVKGIDSVNKLSDLEDMYTVPKYVEDKTESKTLTLGEYKILKTKAKWKLVITEREHGKKLSQATYVNAQNEEVKFNTDDLIEESGTDSSQELTLSHITRRIKYKQSETTKRKIEIGEEDINEEYSSESITISDSKIPIHPGGYINATATYKLDNFLEKDKREEKSYNLKLKSDIYDNRKIYSRFADVKLSNEVSYGEKWASYEYGNRVEYENLEENTRTMIVEKLKSEIREEIKEAAEKEVREEIGEGIEEIREEIKEAEEEKIREEIEEEFKEAIRLEIVKLEPELDEEGIEQKVNEAIEEKVNEEIEQKVNEEIEEKVNEEIEKLKDEIEQKVEEEFQLIPIEHIDLLVVDIVDETMYGWYKSRLSGDYTINYSEKLTLEFGNSKTIYNFTGKDVYSAFYKDYSDDKVKESQDYTNSLEFKINGKDGFKTYYNYSKDFDNVEKETSIKKLEENNGLTFYAGDNIYEYTNSDRDDYENSRNGIKNKKTKLYKYTRKSNVNTNSNKSLTLSYNDEDILDESYSSENSMIKTKTDDYKVDYEYGDKIKREIHLGLNDYENGDNRDLSKYSFDFSFKFSDQREKVEESLEDKLLAYKDVEERDLELIFIAEEENELAKLLKEKKKEETDLKFDLARLGDKKPETYSEFKTYKFIVESTTMKEDYKERGSRTLSNFVNSSSKLKLGFDVNYKRDGFLYEYTQERNLEEDETTKRLHHINGSHYFGKDDKKWIAKYNMNFDDKKKKENKERKLIDYSLEIGREFHCIQLSMNYKQTWNQSDEDYDSIWGVTFGLLTFPEKRLHLERVKDGEDYIIEKSIGM